MDCPGRSLKSNVDRRRTCQTTARSRPTPDTSMNFQPPGKLSEVTFIHDYIQISFQDSGFSLYNRVAVRTEAGLFNQGEPGFCDALVSLIGQRAASVTLDVASALKFAFSGGETIVVLVDDASIRGPEAWQMHPPSGEFVVGQN